MTHLSDIDTLQSFAESNIDINNNEGQVYLYAWYVFLSNVMKI